MGVINAVSDLQEDYRGILHEVRKEDDPTLEEMIINARQYSEDQIVNVAMILHEITERRHHEPSKKELMLAVDFLDHADTLGMEVKFKR